MNASAMVSVDGAGSAGRARGAGGAQQAGGAPADGSFAGLMNTGRPARADEPAGTAAESPAGSAGSRGDAGESDGARAASAEAAAGTARAPRSAPSGECSRDGGSDAEEGEDGEATSCAAQVMALLGVSPPPAAAATPAGPAPARAAAQASPADALASLADGASQDALADALRALPAGLDHRGDARSGLGGPADLAALLGLVGSAGSTGGISPAASDAASAAVALQTLDPGAGAGAGPVAEAPRTRPHAQPLAAHAPTTALLHNPVGSPPWSDELGARLATMVDQGEQLATLQLTPEELGPVEVRIALREGEATVWFGAQAVETRAALEQALPRLRELFASGGLALAHAAVNSDTPRDPQRALANASVARARRETGELAEQPIATSVAIRRGLLDLYA